MTELQDAMSKDETPTPDFLTRLWMTWKGILIQMAVLLIAFVVYVTCIVPMLRNMVSNLVLKHMVQYTPVSDNDSRDEFDYMEDVCELMLDPNTANNKLSLSDDNKKVTEVKEEQPYPDHPERFHHWKQVLCRDGLTGYCYWEVEWRGWVNIGVAYKGIKRTGVCEEGCVGENNKSWGLFCSANGYSACHDKRTTDIRDTSASFGAGRVAVYLDWPAGILSFYRVSADTLIHLHTFHCTFTEPLYPVFRFKLRSASGSSVSLCKIEGEQSAPV